MIIILDTNIILSALIKDSITRRIIIQSGMNFYFPEISMHEIRKHKSLVLKKSGLSEEEYELILSKLLDYTVLVPTENILEHLEEAKSIMQNIDPKDAVFISAALSYENSVIWTDDKDFEKQNKIRILKTGDMFSIFLKSIS